MHEWSALQYIRPLMITTKITDRRSQTNNNKASINIHSSSILNNEYEYLIHQENILTMMTTLLYTIFGRYKKSFFCKLNYTIIK